jgi:hypothetical protein
VQRRVRNHPDVEALVGSTLATARVVTLRMPNDSVEFVLAMHRSSPRDAAADNTAQDGVVCPIEMRTGVLGDVVSIEEHGIVFGPVHPRTGARIGGAHLPFWPETLSLVERAHRLFDRHRLVGWDVALTAKGPVLLEANSVPGAQGLQAAHRTALGRLPYAQQLLTLIEAAECCGSPARPNGLQRH